MSTVVTPTRSPRPVDRLLRLPAFAYTWPRATVFAGVVGLGAFVFLLNLGTSSFFIDEVYSHNVASVPLPEVWGGIERIEVTPPLYYYLLHGWIALTGADSEAALRLPSALAGVALVAAVLWLATIVGGRRAGALAGVFTALSPLVLQYAQEVRSYVWVMLAVTVAAAAVIRYSQQPEQRRWLALAVVASVLALSLNYIAAFITGFLGLWLLFARDVPVWGRLTVLAASGLPLIAMYPLIQTQMAAGHHEVDAYARITNLGLIKLGGTPFDGRGSVGTTISLQLGLLAVIQSLALLGRAQPLRDLPARRLIVLLAAGPVAFVIVMSALVHPMAITRYTAVVAPFMLVALGVAVARSTRLIGGFVGAMALIASIIGLAAALAPSGQFPASRDALEVTGAAWQPGDTLVQMDGLGYRGSLQYYTDRLLPPGTPQAVATPDLPTALDSREVLAAVEGRERLWLMSAPPMWMPGARRMLADLGYGISREWRFDGQSPLQLLLVEHKR